MAREILARAALASTHSARRHALSRSRSVRGLTSLARVLAERCQITPFFFEPLETRLLLAGNVVINEIHYHPNIETEEVEFLELTNAGDAVMDLSGAHFTSGIDYTFASGTTLAPGAFLVVADNPADVLAKWGVAALGPWTGKLSNDGEKITLKSADGTTLDEVTYGTAFPWPVTGDYGDSIELINPTFDNNVPGNWRASSVNAEGTLLPAQSVWDYRKGVSEPPAAWFTPGFNEASDPEAWQTGQTSIGFGDGDDNTNLADMVDSYSTVYLRKNFEVTGAVPNTLLLRLYVDDGAIVYINGTEVKRAHVSTGVKPYNSFGTDHEAAWETFTLTNTTNLLHLGTNTIAMQVLNSALNSNDLSIDAQLIIPNGSFSGPSPGAQNSDFATSTPPLLSDLTQSVQQPVAGQAVTITMKVVDPDGIQSVVLEYQFVSPGIYIRLTDAAYAASWNSFAMHDDGLNGDAVAGDGIYSVTMPAAFQTNRRLVRYRITATDNTNASIRAPYASDTQPNFAYYVYNGVPAWTGADRPGVTAPVTFGTDITNSLPVYQIIANNTDVVNSQYITGYNDVPFYATVVYDGVVYDHIIFTNRGEISTYIAGKNKWAIKFNTGHEFAARDNYGNLYAEKWSRIDLNTNAEPWAPVNRGMAGLDESVSLRLYQLAGVPASNSNYVQLRVVDDAQEAPSNQYNGDMWGLYLAVEHTGGNWLDEHGLPDGNVYKMESGVGDSRNLSPDQVSDGSDLTAFLAGAITSAPLSFWQNNVNLEDFYSFNAINRVDSNIDLRVNANQILYHAPDGHWVIVPWDLDMMLIPETHQPGVSVLNNMLVNAQLKMEYANRARELLDLLFSDKSRTGGQVASVVDEYARFIDKSDGAGAYLNGWAELDQYMWDYNPRSTSDHTGTFYKTPMNDTRRGGTWTRTLVSANFEGSVQYIIDFMTDTDPNSWAIGDGDQRGYGFNYLESEAADPLIPNTPSVTYTGIVGFPTDRLKFTASAFSNTSGSPFAAMEWRIGEISNPGTPGFNPNAPWKYEIDSVWESGELSTFNAQVTVPSGILQAGHTYRLRVRFKDASGRWSHWSDAINGPGQFIAGQPADLIQNSLRITELNYNPPAVPVLPGSSSDNNDYEFVELMNFGSQTINLQNVAFTTGIGLTFGDVTLGPGELGVVTRNTLAFQSRYGTSIKILGQYTGSLDNSGEHIVLTNADATILKDFTYDDTGTGWYPTTDGGGASLVVRNPSLNPDLSNPANWRASLITGGSPGSDETATQLGGAHLFYNNSLFDGNSAAAGTADDAAIASDKSPLLPGQSASFANYSSFSRGINGIMLDLLWINASFSLSDFTFYVGNDNNPANWLAAPLPALSVRTPTPGTLRITLIWDDNVIQNRWLQVTLKGGLGSTSGLAADDVLYFGSAIAETGTDATSARVDATDQLTARAAAKATATVTDPSDFNRDGVVNATDQSIARTNGTWVLNQLQLIAPPLPAAPAMASAMGQAMAPAGAADSDADSALMSAETRAAVPPTPPAASLVASSLGTAASAPALETTVAPLDQPLSHNAAVLTLERDANARSGNWTLQEKNVRFVPALPATPANHRPATLWHAPVARTHITPHAVPRHEWLTTLQSILETD